MTHQKQVFVGVISESNISKVQDVFCCKKCGYGVYGNNMQKYYEQNEIDKHLNGDTLKDIIIKENKVIEVILLFKKNEYDYCCLGYRNYGNYDIEIAFDKLNVNDIYHIAVSIWDWQDCVSFV